MGRKSPWVIVQHFTKKSFTNADRSASASLFQMNPFFLVRKLLDHKKEIPFQFEDRKEVNLG